jgi:hypothetical protein
MTTIIGTRAEATLWRVEYRMLCPKHEGAPAQEQHFKGGTIYVMTANPMGEDVHAVAREAVLGSGAPPQDFSIIAVQRFADAVKGLVQFEGARA